MNKSLTNIHSFVLDGKHSLCSRVKLHGETSVVLMVCLNSNPPGSRKVYSRLQD